MPTEALHARKQASYVRKEQVLAEALAVRWPDPTLDTSLRLAAALGIAALRVATETWRADEARAPCATTAPGRSGI